MNESIIISESAKAYFSAHTSLGAIGTKMRKLKVFEAIVQEVKIAQKIVKYLSFAQRKGNLLQSE
jgi:hypothetical protein